MTAREAFGSLVKRRDVRGDTLRFFRKRKYQWVGPPRGGSFEGVPGPSPWYLQEGAEPIPGFIWRHAPPDSKGSGTFLEGKAGIVAIFGFYFWIMPLSDTQLLVWNQRRVESGSPSAPAVLSVISPGSLEVLDGDTIELCQTMDRDASLLGGYPTDEIALSTIEVDEDVHVSFPEPLRDLDELLILCHSSDINPGHDWHHNDLALLVARPSAGSYRLVPQDWFNGGGFDYGYQWVQRVVRDPATSRVRGEGARIQPFVLDDTLRQLAQIRRGSSERAP